jgi:hypothetical protein
MVRELGSDGFLTIEAISNLTYRCVASGPTKRVYRARCYSGAIRSAGCCWLARRTQTRWLPRP